jgi:hypothetical protein
MLGLPFCAQWKGSSILQDGIEVGERSVGRGEGWALRFYVPLDEE